MAERSQVRPRRGFLTRLRRDKAGNTLAMLAIALIPLLAFVGSAVDIARLYVVKVRLQQACDAGVLAGRKFMAVSASTTLDTNAATQATTFFNNNFKAGLFAAKTVSFTPTKTADFQVAGSASAVVPMTLTKMMGQGDTTVSVTCEARYDVADLDIMFVLDTTGSMAYAATDTSLSGQAVVTYNRADGTTGYYTTEKTNARIKALRTAVLNFYDTLATSADASTQIRYGFVPYTSTVNVGKIIPSSFLRTSTDYSTREDYEADVAYSSSTTNYTNVSQTTCNSYASRTPASGYNASSQAVVKTVSWTKNSTNNNGTCAVTTKTVELKWKFGWMTRDVSGYIAGNWVTDPSKIDGSTSKWQGCIEERTTTATGSFSQTSLPGDLDPDLAATTYDTRWSPMWPDIVYERGGSIPDVYVSNATASGNNYENLGSDAKRRLGWTSCGKQAQRLAVMSRTQVSNFLNDPDFRPMGGTYHDTGMIWGTRFINPNGPFAADTASRPGHDAPSRHIVFMTDGEMAPSLDIYGMYGFERYDRHVTGNNTSTQLARHNARFLAECEAAKRRGITVWVIAFGQALTADMSTCASGSGNAFEADNDDELQDAFASIASRVAKLRISK